jgi:outer membrane receptor protein involved in Fe transport
VTLQVGRGAGGRVVDDGAPDDIRGELRGAAHSLGQGGWQLRAAYLGRFDDPGPNEVAVDSHTLVDAAAGWRFTPAFEMQLLVRNLLDETYLLAPDDRSPLAPGVSAALATRFTF